MEPAMREPNQNPDIVVDLWRSLEDNFFTDAAPIDPGVAPVRRWIQYVPRGVVRHPTYGLMVHDQAFLTEMKDNFEAKVYGIDICMDREHAVDGDTRALAWFTQMEVREDGLWAEVEFTEEGLQKVYRDRAYRYFSPQYGPVEQPDGTVINNVPKGGAATNKPFLKDMVALVASEAFLAPSELHITLTSPTQQFRGVSMDPKSKPVAPGTPPAPTTPPAKPAGDVSLAELQAQLTDVIKRNTELSEQNVKLLEANATTERRLTEEAVERRITQWQNHEVSLTERDEAGQVIEGGKTRKVKVGIPPTIAQKYRDFKLTDAAIPVEEFIEDFLATPAVILSEIGSGFSQEGDRPDEAGGQSYADEDEAETPKVLPLRGEQTLRFAEEWAKAQNLNFADPDVKARALVAVEHKKAPKPGAAAGSY